MWYEGYVDGYHYRAKVYDEGSIYGINEGRISKLWMSRDGRTVVSYDRGWDIRSDAEAQAAFAALGDYLDAAERAEEAGYRQGVLLEETGSAQEAAAAFEALGSYKDSAARAANLQSALERYAAELERVQGQTEALETALAAGEVLLSEDRTPLDEATRTELQAALEAGAAANVELPA